MLKRRLLANKVFWFTSLFALFFTILSAAFLHYKLFLPFVLTSIAAFVCIWYSIHSWMSIRDMDLFLKEFSDD